MKSSISWEEVQTACKNIAEQAKVYEPDCIVAISRGGFIPARLVAEHLNIKHIYSIGLSSYNKDNTQESLSLYQSPFADIISNKHKFALVVDEIADSGNTLKYLSNVWRQYTTVSCIFSAMFVKQHSVLDPSIYYKKINNKNWLIFPWEANY